MGSIFRYLFYISSLQWNLQIVKPETGGVPLSSYEIVMKWGKLNYNFTSREDEKKYLANGDYIPEANVFTDIQVRDMRIFLVVPRWRPGIPASLVYVNHNTKPTSPNNPVRPPISSPLLNPYLGWAFHEIGNCEAFQYVQSIEADIFNRLWVVDTGIHLPNATIPPKCPPKLVLIDLTTDKIILTYNFPREVIAPTYNLLSDLTVECQHFLDSDDCWAYISDSVDGKIVIFQLRNKQSWSVSHPSMKANASASHINILGIPHLNTNHCTCHEYSFATNINGLALSPFDKSFDKIYYSPLSSYHLFSIPTSILKMAGGSGYSTELTDFDVSLVGTKFSQSDGLEMSGNGLLFYGDLSSNAISFWNSSNEFIDPSNEVLLVQNDIDLQWPDSIAFDENGYIYVTSNRIQRALSGTYDFTDINFRIVRIYVGSKSYQYPNVALLNRTSFPTGRSSSSRMTAVVGIMGLRFLVTVLIYSFLSYCFLLN